MKLLSLSSMSLPIKSSIVVSELKFYLINSKFSKSHKNWTILDLEVPMMPSSIIGILDLN